MIERRGPFTDPREGRLLRQIRWAFEVRAVDVLTTHDLLEWCYAAPAIRRLMISRTGKPQSWPREMVKRAALKVCHAHWSIAQGFWQADDVAERS